MAQILASIQKVLGGSEARPLGGPRSFLERSKPREIIELLDGFKHRFTTGTELASLLVAIKRALETHGGLERLFGAGVSRNDANVLPAMTAFVERLRGFARGAGGAGGRRGAGGAGACASLLSSPEDGSACKRLNLYLRWMVRRDAVDPGPWTGISPSLLVVPLDTHLFRIAGELGLTRRRQPNLKTALEVTEGFARLRPDDPVRYDFSLTRLGINPAVARSFPASAPTISARRSSALPSWLGK